MSRSRASSCRARLSRAASAPCSSLLQAATASQPVLRPGEISLPACSSDRPRRARVPPLRFELLQKSRMLPAGNRLLVEDGLHQLEARAFAGEAVRSARPGRRGSAGRSLLRPHRDLSWPTGTKRRRASAEERQPGRDRLSAVRGASRHRRGRLGGAASVALLPPKRRSIQQPNMNWIPVTS